MNTATATKPTPTAAPAPIAPIPSPIPAGHYSRTAVGTMEAAALTLAPDAFARAAAAAIHGILHLALNHLPPVHRNRLGRELAVEIEGFLHITVEETEAAGHNECALVPTTLQLRDALRAALLRTAPETGWIATTPEILICESADGTTLVKSAILRNPEWEDELAHALAHRYNPATGKVEAVPAVSPSLN